MKEQLPSNMVIISKFEKYRSNEYPTIVEKKIFLSICFKIKDDPFPSIS
jgi:hypothetical protein